MKPSRGFTLLEVMIAVAVAALAIVALLELFAGSARLARLSATQTEAVALASSIMDAAMWRAELSEQETGDRVGDYEWLLTIRPIESQLALPAEEDFEDPFEDYELVEVAVTVSWSAYGATKTVRLESARVMERF